MNNYSASKILAAAKRREEKIRATFFITKTAKDALKAWCKQNKVPESAAIDAMIKAVVPSRHFKATNVAERRAAKRRSVTVKEQ
jgi:hypothetical protein